MVTTITSFGRSGLYDWMIQRATAVVLLAYTLFILAYLLFNPELDYPQWKALFEQTWVRVFTLLTLVSIGAHVWIGLWSVSTDYIKPAGPRFLFQAITGAAMFSFLVWGVQVLWGL